MDRKIIEFHPDASDEAEAAENWYAERSLFTSRSFAKYEILQDDGTYYGEIQECPGVYSNAPTLEKCRNELEEVLEEWILFRVYKNLEIPAIDNIEIKIKKQAVA